MGSSRSEFRRNHRAGNKVAKRRHNCPFRDHAGVRPVVDRRMFVLAIPCDIGIRNASHTAAADSFLAFTLGSFLLPSFDASISCVAPTLRNPRQSVAWNLLESLASRRKGSDRRCAEAHPLTAMMTMMMTVGDLSESGVRGKRAATCCRTCYQLSD